jgi:succinate dehydrogenase / fumarate reductase cytochrome b subunit
MRRLKLFWDSNVGKKVVMGATGIVMVLFVMQHVVGVFRIYQSATAINDYANFLKSKPLLVWPARAFLLTCVVLHAVAALQLRNRSRAARPIGYEAYEPQVSTFASRTIRWGGVLLLVFIVFHILHLTTGTLFPQDFRAEDVAGNVIRGFTIWWVSAFYIVSMLALGLHLYHGLWSSPRSLGVPYPRARLRRQVAYVLAIVVAGGFIAVPLGVLAGILKL